MKVYPLILSLALILFSCNSGNTGDNPGSTAEPKVMTEKPSGLELSIERGELQYRKHCLACHQTDGSGNPGMYPPLRQTEFILGDKSALIGIVLNGLSGPIEVNGEIYNSVMTPYNFLTDKQVADLLTYIRNSFGNEADAVSEEEVARIRAGN